MDNIHQFTAKDTINEEAAAWLIRLDGDEPLSAGDREEMQAWMARSTQHRDKLAELARLWGKLNVLTELSVPMATPASKRQSRIRSVLPVAASVLLVGFMALLVNQLFSERWLQTNGDYLTEVGEQRRIELADGSMVTLNTDSRIRVAFSDHYRDIHLLSGEAYFEVAKNRSKPFKVYAGQRSVEAVGTAFSVSLKRRDVDVMVTEGRVALAALLEEVSTAPDAEQGETLQTAREPAKEIGRLQAGQRAVMHTAESSDSGESRVQTDIREYKPQEMERLLSWRQGLLTFAGEPLDQVVEEISRYTSTVILIPDPAVRALRIGGQFEVGDTEAMLEALEASFGLRIVHSNQDEITILAAGE
ncbi:FecR family protein [Pseudomaricurvus alkylphenolicus]|uniref:FecR family protein n=1 Tax=Pseudomaricurvus alkylphenolicus TaxID=1306991 RepID=UPI0014246FF9|nr:FecR family protein [Pseudomaricurvus alkylphenolicus]NIB38117.1 FecR family protein [Pseudomaricurvus alkylphenolicus]